MQLTVFAIIHRALNLFYTAQKMTFSIKFSAISCRLVIFTEEILNGKLHFLCSVSRVLKVLPVLSECAFAIALVACDECGLFLPSD